MTSTTNGRIRIEQTDATLRITLNRPDAGNAFDLPMAHDFHEAAELISEGSSNGLRAVIIDA